MQKIVLSAFIIVEGTTGNLQWIHAWVLQSILVSENRYKTGHKNKSAIIENKAWSEIEAAFLENPNVKNRNKDQLANQWKNLKMLAKKTVGNFKRSQNSTENSQENSSYQKLKLTEVEQGSKVPRITGTTKRDKENNARLELIELQKQLFMKEHEARMDLIAQEKEAACAKMQYYQVKMVEVQQPNVQPHYSQENEYVMDSSSIIQICDHHNEFDIDGPSASLKSLIFCSMESISYSQQLYINFISQCSM
uniref:Regulatory protein zeste n=1 Tax=Romanomermis culicivorax TaxID=13658 RepID=A0A915KW63_ROMCU